MKRWLEHMTPTERVWAVCVLVLTFALFVIQLAEKGHL